MQMGDIGKKLASRFRKAKKQLGDLRRQAAADFGQVPRDDLSRRSSRWGRATVVQLPAAKNRPHPERTGHINHLLA
jgi:hypothetical protein